MKRYLNLNLIRARLRIMLDVGELEMRREYSQ